MFEKVKEKGVQFMADHPKFTKGLISGSAALATIGTTGIVASAEGEETTSTADAALDSVISTMQTSLTSTVLKVIPAVVGIGVIVVGFNFAWSKFKKMTK